MGLWANANSLIVEKKKDAPCGAPFPVSEEASTYQVTLIRA